MNNQEIVVTAKTLMNEISNAISDFASVTQKYIKKEITEEEMKSQILSKLSSKSEEELIEYNEMCKMLSMTNCGVKDYLTREVMHDAILELLGIEPLFPSKRQSFLSLKVG